MQLKTLIGRILSHNPSRKDVKEFVTLCHRLGLLCVSRKQIYRHLDVELFGLSLRDIALDCISDVFGRDDQGSFKELKTYYDGVRWSTLSEAELLSYTRRLIFSKVNQEIVRRYRAFDPSLDRLIRNLRNAVRHSTFLKEERIGNELWVRSAKDPASSLPMMSSEFIEAHLSPRLHGQPSLPQILDAVTDLFEGQSFYRRGYPMVGLALIVRAIFVRMEQTAVSGAAHLTDSISPQEMTEILTASVQAVMKGMDHSYVEKGKVDRLTYIAYFSAIRDALSAEFVEHLNPCVSLHAILSAHLKALTAEQYQKNHRNRLEYLLRLTRRHFLSAVRLEFLNFP